MLSPSSGVYPSGIACRPSNVANPAEPCLGKGSRRTAATIYVFWATNDDTYICSSAQCRTMLQTLTVSLYGKQTMTSKCSRYILT